MDGGVGVGGLAFRLPDDLTRRAYFLTYVLLVLSGGLCGACLFEASSHMRHAAFRLAVAAGPAGVEVCVMCLSAP